MQFLNVIGYEIVLVFHILSAIVAVGTVTIVDYLHIVGLRDRRIEKKLLFVYGLLSKILHFTIVLIILSGAILVIHKPELLSSPIFLSKMALFGIAIINGIYLNKIIFPEMDSCVRLGKDHCSLDILFKSSLSGAISIVTWYSILILVLTKKFNHSLGLIWGLYFSTVLIAFIVAYFMERRARVWK